MIFGSLSETNLRRYGFSAVALGALALGMSNGAAQERGQLAHQLRVPELVGRHDTPSLDAHLQASGFTGFRIIVYITTRTATRDGVIIRQRPRAGASVPLHSNIDIWVLKYNPAPSNYSASIRIVGSDGNDVGELVLPPQSSGASSTTYREIVTYTYPCVTTPGYGGDGLILNVSTDDASTYIPIISPAVANTEPTPGEMKLTCGGTHQLTVAFNTSGWECSGKITFDAEVIKDRQPSSSGRYPVLAQLSLPFIDNSGNGFCP